MQSGPENSGQTFEGDQQHVIQITGDDDLSRLARVNDLVLVKCVRETSGLDLRQSMGIVRALRWQRFNLSDDAIARVIPDLDAEAVPRLIQSIRGGVEKGFQEIDQQSPFGTNPL